MCMYAHVDSSSRIILLRMHACLRRARHGSHMCHRRQAPGNIDRNGLMRQAIAPFEILACVGLQRDVGLLQAPP